jgi:hypothetical protein
VKNQTAKSTQKREMAPRMRSVFVKIKGKSVSRFTRSGVKARENKDHFRKYRISV